MLSITKPGKIVLSGDHEAFLKEDKGVTKVIICNHVTDIDYAYVVKVLQSDREHRMDGNLKVLMKASLRKIPLVGGLMKASGQLFLSRDKTKDEAYIVKKVNQLLSNGDPVLYICLFPEGTTINVEDQEKGNVFATKHNRPLMKHLILPRSAGVEIILHAIKSPVQVFDLTLSFDGFSGEIPTYAMGYTRNVDVKTPSIHHAMHDLEVADAHIHVKRVNMESYDSVENMLDTVWVEKDAMLSRFIETKSFL